MAFRSAAATTIEFPSDLPAIRRDDHWVARAGEVELRLTNLEKIFWPETGYTKGDLLTYYYNVSPCIVPRLVNRPLTLKRMPEGVVGPYFYEKDAPSYTPAWMPTLSIGAIGEDRTIRFVTVRDVASLLWVANLGCIEFHPHHSVGEQQARPTYAVFDLDPFHPAGMEEAKRVASLLKVALDRLGLESYPKTSGATGIQIYVPLDGAHGYDEVRAFAGKVSMMVHRADPEITTMEWDLSKRTGKVFLDANLNRAGASLIAAYSARSEWNAPVSMPFTWEELDTVDPVSFTLATAPERIATAGDVFAPPDQPGASLAETFERLSLS